MYECVFKRERTRKEKKNNAMNKKKLWPPKPL
jgi:hypothetical protein